MASPSQSVKNAIFTILVVDDKPVNLRVVFEALREEGYRVLVAEDGASALRQATKVKPDMVLLDIMMPKLSGFEVCKAVKDDPATREIMILMVTALNELGDIERAVNAGCDDFLSKPVNKIELLKRVENMLKLRSIKDELQRLREYIDGMDER